MLERFEARIPVHYRSFLNSVKVGGRFSSERAVLEHLIEWYAVDVESRWGGDIPPNPIPVERSRVAMYRYKLGVVDHMRLLSELDAAMKLDATEHEELRRWQYGVKAFAGHMQQKFAALDVDTVSASTAALATVADILL